MRITVEIPKGMKCISCSCWVRIWKRFYIVGTLVVDVKLIEVGVFVKDETNGYHLHQSKWHWGQEEVSTSDLEVVKVFKVVFRFLRSMFQKAWCRYMQEGKLHWLEPDGLILQSIESIARLHKWLNPRVTTFIERRGSLWRWRTRKAHNITEVVIDDKVQCGAG